MALKKKSVSCMLVQRNSQTFPVSVLFWDQDINALWMTFTSQNCGINHRHMKDMTKFVSLLNIEPVVIELCCAYSSNFCLHNNVNDIPYEVIGQR